MKTRLIFTCLLAALAAPALAQNKAAAPAKATAAQAKPAALTDVEKAAQELKALNEKERAELKAIDETAAPVTKKYQARMKDLQGQIKTLSDTYRASMDATVAKMFAARAKYAAQKYALMNRLNPGAGTRMQEYDKAVLALEAGWKKDLNAITEAETAEMNRGGLSDAAAAKFQADRKTLAEAYNARRRELQNRLFPQQAPAR